MATEHRLLVRQMAVSQIWRWLGFPKSRRERDGTKTPPSDGTVCVCVRECVRGCIIFFFLLVGTRPTSPRFRCYQLGILAALKGTSLRFVGLFDSVHYVMVIYQQTRTNYGRVTFTSILCRVCQCFRWLYFFYYCGTGRHRVLYCFLFSFYSFDLLCCAAQSGFVSGSFVSVCFQLRWALFPLSYSLISLTFWTVLLILSMYESSILFYLFYSLCELCYLWGGCCRAYWCVCYFGPGKIRELTPEICNQVWQCRPSLVQEFRSVGSIEDPAAPYSGKLELMELENIVANTVYLKAREGNQSRMFTLFFCFVKIVECFLWDRKNSPVSVFNCVGIGEGSICLLLIDWSEILA